MSISESMTKSEFEKLMRPYRPYLKSFLSHRLNSTRDVEDLLQDISIRLWENRDKFRASAKFSTWANRIAVNMLIDHVRYESRRRHMPILHDGLSTDNFQISEYQPLCIKNFNYESVEIEIIVDQILSVVGSEHRELFVMKINQVDETEMSLYTDIAVGTIKSRIYRARQALRKNHRDLVEGMGVYD